MTRPLLEMKSISKSFGSLLANDSIDLSLNEGEILAVVGENGAGKSTLMKILYGLQPADSGEIFLRGTSVTFRNPQEAIKHGIGMVQQHFMLFPEYRVFENIVYSKEPKKSGIFFDREKAVSDVLELAEKYGLAIDPMSLMKDCPVGIEQRVEILKVLYQDADVIIFDEPTAVLTPQEIKELLATIKNLSSMGKSIILITHKLQEVMEIADRVMVMRDGQLIKVLDKDETSIAEMSYLMVGRDLEIPNIKQNEPGEAVLVVEDLRCKNAAGAMALKGLNLTVHSGEVVGIAGVSENGQSELILALMGLIKPDSGKILMEGKDLVGKRTDEFRNFGIACIPEDRYKWGCAKPSTLRETSIMGHHRKSDLQNRGILKNDGIISFSEKLLSEYDVRHSDSKRQKAGELSGGNIQKLIVAREIEHGSKLLIAAEPTRGIDIGAMEYIHNMLLEKRAKGDAVLLISSELSEIMLLSDRILVIYDGKISGEFTRSEATPEKLGYLMMGGNHE